MQKYVKAFMAITVFLTTTSVEAAKPVSSEDAYAQALTNRSILVDVREESEIRESGMAEFAVWLPTSSIKSQDRSYLQALEMWPWEQKLVFYGHTGAQAEKAADHFGGLGYRTLNAGSFQDWKDADLPTKGFGDSAK